MTTNCRDRLLSLVMTGAVAALVTACGGSGEPEDHASMSHSSSSASSSSGEATDQPATEQSEPPSADGPAIVIEGFSFGDPLTVAPGATIAVTNSDLAPHTVTSDAEGLFDLDLDGGASGTLTAPTEPGEYTYICRYHPGMTGTLIVQ